MTAGRDRDRSCDRVDVLQHDRRGLVNHDRSRPGHAGIKRADGRVEVDAGSGRRRQQSRRDIVAGVVAADRRDRLQRDIAGRRERSAGRIVERNRIQIAERSGGEIAARNVDRAGNRQRVRVRVAINVEVRIEPAAEPRDVDRVISAAGVDPQRADWIDERRGLGKRRADRRLTGRTGIL